VSCMRRAKLTGDTVSACRLAAYPGMGTRSIWGTSDKRLEEAENAGSLGRAVCSSAAYVRFACRMVSQGGGTGTIGWSGPANYPRLTREESELLRWPNSLG
jgi:hypothetical protein